MNKEQQELLDEVYEKYHQENKHVMYLTFLLEEEFINKCKTDTEFSERWGLNIEERELSLEERVRIYGVDKIQTNDAGYYEHSYTQFKVDEAKIPTKLITITYNDKTITSYE
jgi:hypothetical protein